MGCSSNDTAQLIIRQYKDEIEAIKNDIKESMQKKQGECYSIIFKLMNGKSFSILCLKNTKLFNVFLLLVEKAKDSNYSSLGKLKIYYNAIDITHFFTKDSNKDVSSLNFTTYNPVVHINN